MQNPKIPLQTFKFKSILNQDPMTKSVVLLGTLPHENEEKDAILVCNKTPFLNLEELTGNLSNLQMLDHNDVYTWLTASISQGPDVKLYLIHPATPLHISKYTKHRPIMICETPTLYQQVVLPWIEAIPKSRISWVYNILDHKNETENITVEDADKEKGFILLPDSKWDRTTLENLYLVAIFHSDKVKSLRDLRGSHVEMLKSMKNRTMEALKSKYPNLDPEQIRMYIHYLPSYYHLHVHVTHLMLDQGENAAGTSIGKAHLLEDVIQNLQMDSDYYLKRNLYYTVTVDEADVEEAKKGGVAKTLWAEYCRKGLDKEATTRRD